VRVLELLEAEIVECLGLLGVANVGALNAKHLCKEEFVYPPDLHSAFPLLRLPQYNY